MPFEAFDTWQLVYTLAGAGAVPVMVSVSAVASAGRASGRRA